ncbi:hypothetical protein BLNAU_21781 [Blattamonas nauphoetae]|uniref:Uncharacterized protein n=1 Tax=Blattamonas nauphoetae TaxID=2049346 RepID=A0ABQ9WUX8_9EUKA|nr:hypothetical protein BLNAU_21781 [Blattamonas nauphoetae]
MKEHYSTDSNTLTMVPQPPLLIVERASPSINSARGHVRDAERQHLTTITGWFSESLQHLLPFLPESHDLHHENPERTISSFPLQGENVVTPSEESHLSDDLSTSEGSLYRTFDEKSHQSETEAARKTFAKIFMDVILGMYYRNNPLFGSQSVPLHQVMSSISDETSSQNNTSLALQDGTEGIGIPTSLVHSILIPRIVSTLHDKHIVTFSHIGEKIKKEILHPPRNDPHSDTEVKTLTLSKLQRKALKYIINFRKQSILSYSNFDDVVDGVLKVVTSPMVEESMMFTDYGLEEWKVFMVVILKMIEENTEEPDRRVDTNEDERVKMWWEELVTTTAPNQGELADQLEESDSEQSAGDDSSISSSLNDTASTTSSDQHFPRDELGFIIDPPLNDADDSELASVTSHLSMQSRIPQRMPRFNPLAAFSQPPFLSVVEHLNCLHHYSITLTTHIGSPEPDLPPKFDLSVSSLHSQSSSHLSSTSSLPTDTKLRGILQTVVPSASDNQQGVMDTRATRVFRPFLTSLVSVRPEQVFRAEDLLSPLRTLFIDVLLPCIEITSRPGQLHQIVLDEMFIVNLLQLVGSQDLLTAGVAFELCQRLLPHHLPLFISTWDRLFHSWHGKTGAQVTVALQIMDSWIPPMNHFRLPSSFNFLIDGGQMQTLAYTTIKWGEWARLKFPETFLIEALRVLCRASVVFPNSFSDCLSWEDVFSRFSQTNHLFVRAKERAEDLINQERWGELESLISMVLLACHRTGKQLDPSLGQIVADYAILPLNHLFAHWFMYRRPFSQYFLTPLHLDDLMKRVRETPGLENNQKTQYTDLLTAMMRDRDSEKTIKISTDQNDVRARSTQRSPNLDQVNLQDNSTTRHQSTPNVFDNSNQQLSYPSPAQDEYPTPSSDHVQSDYRPPQASQILHFPVPLPHYLRGRSPPASPHHVPSPSFDVFSHIIQQVLNFNLTQNIWEKVRFFHKERRVEIYKRLPTVSFLRKEDQPIDQPFTIPVPEFINMFRAWSHQLRFDPHNVTECPVLFNHEFRISYPTDAPSSLAQSLLNLAVLFHTQADIRLNHETSDLQDEDEARLRSFVHQMIEIENNPTQFESFHFLNEQQFMFTTDKPQQAPLTHTNPPSISVQDSGWTVAFRPPEQCCHHSRTISELALLQLLPITHTLQYSMLIRYIIQEVPRFHQTQNDRELVIPFIVAFVRLLEQLGTNPTNFV